MDSKQLSMRASTFQSVLDAATLDTRGDHLAFCQRQRLITPFRFVLSVVASMATKQVYSIADLHRDGNALWDMEVSYKAFYTQLAKAPGADLLRTSLGDLMGKLPCKYWGFNRVRLSANSPGSSFRTAAPLPSTMPWATCSRAASTPSSRLLSHCTLEVLRDAPLTVVLSPDTDAEHAYLPEPASLSGALFLADRGYLDLSYLRHVDRHGGSFIVRAKEGLHPRVLDAFREDGKRMKACQDRDLQAILTQLPKKQRAELDVEWLIDHQPLRLRLIVSWNKAKKCFVYLLTNLPQSRYNIEQICLGYKIRWQVELLFKEWKSHANLHAFDTENEYITESLIWASLTAATLKRFLAHAAEHLLAVVISTRKAAMMPAYVLPELFRSLRHGDGPWLHRTCTAMMRYLGKNAKRAHPKRDVRTGRAQLGLKAIFELTEHKAFMDSSGEQLAA